jgi:hypothetical protein
MGDRLFFLRNRLPGVKTIYSIYAAISGKRHAGRRTCGQESAPCAGEARSEDTPNNIPVTRVSTLRKVIGAQTLRHGFGVSEILRQRGGDRVFPSGETGAFSGPLARSLDLRPPQDRNFYARLILAAILHNFSRMAARSKKAMAIIVFSNRLTEISGVIRDYPGFSPNFRKN